MRYLYLTQGCGFVGLGVVSVVVRAMPWVVFLLALLGAV